MVTECTVQYYSISSTILLRLLKMVGYIQYYHSLTAPAKQDLSRSFLEEYLTCSMYLLLSVPEPLSDLIYEFLNMVSLEKTLNQFMQVNIVHMRVRTYLLTWDSICTYYVTVMRKKVTCAKHCIF